MENIIGEMLEAASKSIDELKRQINNVKLAPLSSEHDFDQITFTLNGREYLGALRGRNRDCMVGIDPVYDAAIACRVFLDGDAKPV